MERVWYSELADKYPIHVVNPVYWRDMDAARHVNNGVYGLWFENARIQFMDSFGAKLSDRGSFGFILAYQDLKYIRPIEFPDEVFCGAYLSKITEDYVILRCRIYNSKGELTCICNGKMVGYNYETLAKAKIPNEFRTQLLPHVRI